MIDDVDRIMAVMQAAFDPLYGEAWNRRQVEDSLSLGHCHYGVIAAEGLPCAGDVPAAGFFMSRNAFHEEELLLLAVKPEFRRYGLGRKLLDTLRRDAGARGAQRLLLEMRRGNPAEALYAAFGFYKIGERPNYYRTSEGDRLDAITFACDIS
ncbi:GNAT family N-acetyltransferase [Novosphingobium sp. 9]|uniref:GNAT family N-acetyltransferase n=1 Tax=Novosphingobium sp. 9 TaxID=2025349 RepID=UPI0021B4E34D|nr:GNAT family N-acetyltransferase [Novosphingobium sp. 9]